ncbi:TetR/AcrR family transcriptional regulator [Parvibaculaceae bacterium PLY_AMNH_Bact1]|nr:TetR/AcrR family transcriptional regulator [Parvibaculaceae bacterium PLY_AMNH_Bact1]
MSSDAKSTREKILAASLELLESGQGNSVRMSDIAAKVGITRQALYLHFRNRGDLLIATTHYVDELHGGDERLIPSRTAKTGIERLDAFISAWAGFLPEIYGIGKALLAMRDSDPEAAAAWDKRMQDMREGCEAAILALARDKTLTADYSPGQATDILWTMLSLRNWEQLTVECGWARADYAERMQATARRLFVVDAP